MPITRSELDSAGLEEYELPEEYATRWIGYLRSHLALIDAVGARDSRVNVLRAAR